MHKLPFTALASLQAPTVDLTLFGARGSIIATVTFTEAEARELQRQLGVALYDLGRRPLGRDQT